MKVKLRVHTSSPRDVSRSVSWVVDWGVQLFDHMARMRNRVRLESVRAVDRKGLDTVLVAVGKEHSNHLGVRRICPVPVVVFDPAGLADMEYLEFVAATIWESLLQLPLRFDRTGVVQPPQLAKARAKKGGA